MPTATPAETWAAIRGEFARLPGLSAAALALLVAAAATGLVSPWVLGRLVDDVMAGADSTRVAGWAAVIGPSPFAAGPGSCCARNRSHPVRTAWN
ncbi:hypothetical protein AB0F81_50575, partial [Actinoplanes sp. NPDC024001]